MKQQKNLTHYDPMGECVWAYWNGNTQAEVTVYSSLDEPSTITAEYLFRDLDTMPAMEQLALQLSKGRILDVGACAGCHSIVLQNLGYDVTALEISAPAVKTLKARNIATIHQSIWELKDQKFDTILLLMNGIGLGGTPQATVDFLAHLKTLLNPKGQIIGDSANIIEAYMEEDGSVMIELTGKYYGQVEYQLEFEGNKGNPFEWLYIDFDLLSECAQQAGLSCEIVDEGETDNYLVVMQIL